MRLVERKEYNIFMFFLRSQMKNIYYKSCFALSFGLYYIYIRVIEIYAAINLKFMNPDIFAIHNRLGLGSIKMRKIIENSHGHPFNLMNYRVMLALKTN